MKRTLTPEIPVPMTTPEYVSLLQAHLGEDLDTDTDAAPVHAQRARILLDHIGALAGPEAAIDRRILSALATVEVGLREAKAWADDAARRG